MPDQDGGGLYASLAWKGGLPKEAEVAAREAALRAHLKVGVCVCMRACMHVVPQALTPGLRQGAHGAKSTINASVAATKYAPWRPLAGPRHTE